MIRHLFALQRRRFTSATRHLYRIAKTPDDNLVPGSNDAILTERARQDRDADALRQRIDRFTESLPKRDSARKRVHPVSSSACDDVLEYMKPSLQKHVGCTLIDINPGAGLLSRKLNEFLRPRKHILMEPSQDMFDTFLKPLVESPDSTYVHTPLPPSEHSSFDALWADGVLEPPASDGQSMTTDSILVTANLGAAEARTGTQKYKSQTLSKQMTEHWISAIGDGKLFHRHGRVRMLLWIEDEDKLGLLPSYNMAMTRFHWLADRLAEMYEVAGSEERIYHTKRTGRTSVLEQFDFLRVASKMREAGVKVPAYRGSREHEAAVQLLDQGELSSLRDLLADTVRDHAGQPPSPSVGEVVSFLEKDIPEDNLLGCSTRTTQSLRHLKAKWERGEMRLPKAGKAPSQIWQQVVRIWQKHQKGLIPKSTNPQLCADMLMLEEVVELEKSIQATADPAKVEEQKSRHQQLLIEAENMKNGISKMQADVLVDDYLGFVSDPPRLMRDRRTFEPLKVVPEEFHPKTQLALMDIRPRDDPTVDRDHMSRIKDMLIPLSSQRNKPLAVAMEGLSPGASAILDDVPELRDIAKGGRLDPGRMATRMLTSEMLDGLVRAWRDWPFRPPGSDATHYFELQSYQYIKLKDRIRNERDRDRNERD